MRDKVSILDSTLRDGAQGSGIAFSVEDKLAALRLLDRLGVGYIEAGNPGSNPKDQEFFRRAAAIPLGNARLTAFGSTRRKGLRPEGDASLQALLEGGTEQLVRRLIFFCPRQHMNDLAALRNCLRSMRMQFRRPLTKSLSVPMPLQKRRIASPLIRAARTQSSPGRKVKRRFRQS